MTEKCNRIKLPHGNSWVEIYSSIPEEIQLSEKKYKQLWNEHPDELSTGKMFGKTITFPRWQQSYGKTLRFAGQDCEGAPIENDSMK